MCGYTSVPEDGRTCFTMLLSVSRWRSYVVACIRIVVVRSLTCMLLQLMFMPFDVL